jgi:patatin-like phospholipase/acyl hydrolase
MKTLQQHFDPVGPKRILALDGGGIRGALTLGYLQKIEDILRKQHGDNPEFRLCDYFDLIGGTSTGSIIASCLAIGMKVDKINEMYMELGGKIFARKYQWWNIFETGDF